MMPLLSPGSAKQWGGTVVNMLVYTGERCTSAQVLPAFVLPPCPAFVWSDLTNCKAELDKVLLFARGMTDQKPTQGPPSPLTPSHLASL